MQQSRKPLALVVEDDEMQRDLIVMLFEESEMDVVQCESAEAALAALEKVGDRVKMIFTDVSLAGSLSGVDLARIAKQRFPDLCVLVTSGKRVPELPDGTRFLPKPWMPLDLLREAERVQMQR